MHSSHFECVLLYEIYWIFRFHRFIVNRCNWKWTRRNPIVIWCDEAAKCKHRVESKKIAFINLSCISCVISVELALVAFLFVVAHQIDAPGANSSFLPPPSCESLSRNAWAAPLQFWTHSVSKKAEAAPCCICSTAQWLANIFIFLLDVSSGHKKLNFGAYSIGN